MADRVFEIEFRSIATGDGAQTLKTELDGLKAALDQAAAVSGGTGAASAIEDVAKAAEMVKETVPMAERELQRFVEANRVVSSTVQPAGVHLESLRKTMSGVSQTMRGGTEAIGGLSTALQGLSRALPALGQLGLAVSAAKIGYDIGKSIEENLLTPLLKASEGYDLIIEQAGEAKQAMSSAAQVKSQYDELRSQIQSVGREYESVISKVRQLEQSQQSLRKAETERKISDVRASSELAAAGAPDAATAEAIRARAAVQIKALEAEGRIADEAEKQADLQRELAEKSGNLVEIQNRIDQAAAAAASKWEEYERKLNILRSAGIDPARMLVDREYASGVKGSTAENANAAAASGASSESLDLIAQAASSLRDVQLDALNSSDQAKQFAQENAGRLSELKATIDILNNNVAASGEKMRTAQNENAVSMLEAGRKTGEAATTIKTAIDTLTAQLSAAKNNLAVAQGSTGSPASGAEQTAAFQRVQEIEMELQRLRSLQDTAATEVKAAAGRYGEAFTAGAESVRQTSEAAKSTLDSAGQTVKAAADASTAALDGAAAQVVQSTTAGIGRVAGSMEKLGSGVNGSVEKVAAGVERVAEVTVQKLDAVARRIAAVEAVANAARQQSDQNTSQIAAMR